MTTELVHRELHDPHRESGDETRTRIIDVALALMAERGFAATSTREISERLGFTKAALYYHFRTKDDLLAAIMGPAITDLAELVAGTAPRPTPTVRRRALARYVDLVASHEELIRVLYDDPSVRGCAPMQAAKPLYQELVGILAGTDEPDTVQRVRVRAALGGIHTAVLRGEPDEDREVVRATALVAACGALGLSAPRHGGGGGPA